MERSSQTDFSDERTSPMSEAQREAAFRPSRSSSHRGGDVRWWFALDGWRSTTHAQDEFVLA